MRWSYPLLIAIAACGDDAAKHDAGAGSDDGAPADDAAPWLVCAGDTPPMGMTCASPPALRLEVLPFTFTLPVFVTTSRCDPTRLYIVEKGGRIELVKGGVRSTFLDVSSLVKSMDLSEGGLLGLAFHPDYEDNGRFFIFYSAQPNGRTKIIEYRRSANADVADPTAVATLLDATQQGDQHVGGTLAFGRDGMLYASLGDFGTSSNAQDPSSVHGKILRFDVSVTAPTPEVFASGLRNPYRFSFDRATGDIYIGDVGNVVFEEINIGPALSAGRNYGWPTIDGPCSNCGLTIPPAQYHERTDDEMGARCIIGGYVYRGSAIPCLYGFYIYGDYNYEARGWALRWDGNNGVSGSVTPLKTDLFGGMTPQPQLVSFGEDATGELYAIDIDGRVFRVLGE